MDTGAARWAGGSLNAKHRDLTSCYRQQQEKILNVAEKNRYGGLEEVGDTQNSSGLSENSLKIPNNC